MVNQLSSALPRECARTPISGREPQGLLKEGGLRREVLVLDGILEAERRDNRGLVTSVVRVSFLVQSDDAGVNACGMFPRCRVLQRGGLRLKVGLAGRRRRRHADAACASGGRIGYGLPAELLFSWSGPLRTPDPKWLEPK
uniref:Uncharacterized protein n=1 Tax=Prorocentrum micans TaxID=2945 RepID=A0A7S2X5Y5_PROMC|mmetsp:Transcript_793/g.568  ORF Transcript_793/g.568 Transcript_793/m.568 type:complete len:141 (+) Transcript_793:54-476(+)